MKCHVCGAELQATVTDMPFKTGARAIVILRDLPVLACGNCGQFLLEDPVMDRVETILARVQDGAELEVVHYAA